MESPGQYSGRYTGCAERTTANLPRTKAESMGLMEAVCERGNLLKAYDRVVRNKGAAGVDGIGNPEFKAHLQKHWPAIKGHLMAGTYVPNAVRRVDIPKPQGGTRMLGIPTLTDRLIQQALHQVLSPLFEPTFSDSSYGFRPGKSAHQAVKAAQRYSTEGRQIVVDLDLSKFFDRVNHDILMGLIAREVGDDRVLLLIRRYLEAGMMDDGLIQPRREGTPQGGPLSPLLSNILLTELDRELGKQGHAFCRFADDCNTYVRSRRAGERVKRGITRFLAERLKLEVNETKSAVDSPNKRKFLGYTFSWHHRPKLKVSISSLKRLMGNIRELMRKGRGRSVGATIHDLNPMLRGWAAYFRWVETRQALSELDQWVRRKLRCIIWRQWKRPATRYANLKKAGLKEDQARKSASNGRGPWWNSGKAHMNFAFPKKYFDKLGLVSVLKTVQRLQCSS